eukprot:3468576-Amphidinium_carterae.1
MTQLTQSDTTCWNKENQNPLKVSIPCIRFFRGRQSRKCGQEHATCPALGRKGSGAYYTRWEVRVFSDQGAGILQALCAPCTGLVQNTLRCVAVCQSSDSHSHQQQCSSAGTVNAQVSSSDDKIPSRMPVPPPPFSSWPPQS